MRVRAGFISLLAGTTLAISGLSAPVASATAARSPSWHVVYRQSGLNVIGVRASGPRNAWAYGNGKLGGGKLLHWNGARWAAVSYPRQNTYLITAAFVLSPTDAWFAGQNETPPQYTPEILHWQNGSWSWLQLPSASNVATVDVLADDDIWSVGGDIPGCPGGGIPGSQGCTPTEHWNGTGWRSYPLHTFEWVSFASSSRTNVWAIGASYGTPGSRNRPETFVQYAFRWTGSGWLRSTVAGVRSAWITSLVVDSPTSVWLAGPSRAAPKACAVRWTGKAWRPLYLPGHRTCLGAVTDHRRGFWTVLWPGTVIRGRDIVGFAFLHWTGTRYSVTPTYVPSKNGWNTNGFMITAVPQSSRVWVYGSYCAVSRVCNNQGVIATLS